MTHWSWPQFVMTHEMCSACSMAPCSCTILVLGAHVSSGREWVAEVFMWSSWQLGHTAATVSLARTPSIFHSSETYTSNGKTLIHRPLGVISIQRCRLTSIQLKIRRSPDRLIFNIGISIPGKTVFILKWGPWPLFYTRPPPMQNNCHWDTISVTDRQPDH